LAAAVVALAGCGGGARSPESVVRAWSKALNAGDNEAAANLFATGAEVVQGGTVIHFRTHGEAVAWNAGLPCSGSIVSLRRDGSAVTATFLLGDRPASACDAPGQKATAVFRVQDGKIVLWHQVEVAEEPPTV
jgi:limonene-1,2-epoxide hydrolase